MTSSAARSAVIPLGGEPRGPEVECGGGADAPDDAVDHAGRGATAARSGVLEERHVAAGPAVLGGVEEMVDGRVVLVDGLGDEPQAEDARVEVDVPGGVTGDGADVVDALELHGVPFRPM
nr:hypothetical protein [Conexibacter sp. W3-3-2]